jgi:hypothetical protein
VKKDAMVEREHFKVLGIMCAVWAQTNEFVLRTRLFGLLGEEGILR